MHTTETLKALLIQGVNIKVDAKSISINDLTEMAVLASNNSAQLTVTNASALLKGALENIASIGGQSLSIEF